MWNYTCGPINVGWVNNGLAWQNETLLTLGFGQTLRGGIGGRVSEGWRGGWRIGIGWIRGLRGGRRNEKSGGVRLLLDEVRVETIEART